MATYFQLPIFAISLLYFENMISTSLFKKHIMKKYENIVVYILYINANILSKTPCYVFIYN